jgi:hypothetical protein
MIGAAITRREDAAALLGQTRYVTPPGSDPDRGAGRNRSS